MAEQINIPGLVLCKNYIIDKYEDFLINFIKTQDWNLSLSRLTQHYGYEYDYTRSQSPKPTKPIPYEFSYIKTCIENATNFHFDQCIINEYSLGHGISPHIDHQKQFDSVIATLSLGSPCTFQFSKFNENIKNWKHGIPKRKDDRTGVRYSITFRKILK